MATNNILGIDFGSTNSAFAVIEDDSPEIIANGERNPTTPSVIAFTDEGKPVVGEPAETLASQNKTQAVRSIKRHLGKSDYTAL